MWCEYGTKSTNQPWQPWGFGIFWDFQELTSTDSITRLAEQQARFAKGFKSASLDGQNHGKPYWIWKTMEKPSALPYGDMGMDQQLLALVLYLGWKMMKIHWPVYWCSLPIGYQALDICWPLQRKLRVSRSLRRTARLRWRSTNNRWGSQGFPVFPRGQENWQEFPQAFRFVPGAASEPIAAWSAENAADELCAREGVVMDGHGDGGANVGQFYLDH